MALRDRLGACCAALALALPADGLAQVDEPPVHALTGTLKRIRDAGLVRIGYREAAVPFSYARAGGEPWGYSIDLCLAIVEDLSAAVGGRPLRVEYRLVTPANRIEQVAEGRIDLECGSTTSNAERRQRVAFSPVIYIAGTRLLVKRGSAVRSLRDLGGKAVVAVAGTTNARAMVALGAGQVRNLRVLTAASYEQALTMLATDAVDAMAADDVLIAGLLDERGLRDRYVMVGEALTREPYGITFARDAAMEDVVRATFARLAASRELRLVYNRWFVRTLPSGARVNLPMSTELERAFQILGLPPE
jgi:glutamate/aspartate transport system substrate-binding protein